MPFTPSRRRLLQATGASGVLLATGLSRGATLEAGRFTTRPTAPDQTLAPGEYVLADNGARRALLYLPPTYTPATPHPFALMFHGARGDGDSTLASTRAAADAQGVILLCPSTRQGTWDAIRGGFAHDFTAMDALLQQSFARCAIDPGRLAIGGFSDGASYGLSLGLINGDLFTHVIAHSPGFIIADHWHGKPNVYVSHGRQDQVLPFDRCGAAIVTRLRAAGYEPRFDVFDGGHTASPELRSAALEWLRAG
ncbi:MAG TPA: phospholipase [Hyphomicrobiales bacterium]|nr:phospholipase [Hyphomicrobiales bacterium]